MLIKHALHYLAAGAVGYALTFGDRTPNAWGGDDAGYAGAGTLLITTGNDAGDWTIDTDNYLVPSGVRAAVGGFAVPKVYSSAAYVLTVTDGVGFSQTVNITMLANDVTIRIAKHDGTFYDPNEWYEAHHCLNVALKGHNVWMRSGDYNISNFNTPTEPFDESLYGGTVGGKITFRSIVVDTSVDAQGDKNRRHGSRINRALWTAQSVGVTPIRYEDVYFYNSVAPVDGQTGLFNDDHAAANSGLEFFNCGFENAAALTDVEVSNCGGLSYSGDDLKVTYCTFYRVGYGMGCGGNRLISQHNVFHHIIDADAHQVGGDTQDHLVQYNKLYDQYPVSEGHCDFLQIFGCTITGLHLGTISHNKIYGTNAQGVWIADGAGGQYASGLIELNIIHTDSIHGIYAAPFDNITIQKNTVLTHDFNSLSAITVEGGAAATYTRNVANQLGGTQTAFTSVPNPNATISEGGSKAALIANLVAAFPGYVHPTVATDFSDAGITTYFTPSAAWYAANSNSSALDSTGAWNAA